MPGEFIDVQVDAKIAKDVDLAKKLAEICPVSIFEATSDGVQIDESNLDECVLCDLCVCFLTLRLQEKRYAGQCAAS